MKFIFLKIISQPKLLLVLQKLRKSISVFWVRFPTIIDTTRMGEIDAERDAN